MENTRRLANALETVIRDFRAQAQKAVVQNRGRLLVPASMDYGILCELARHPEITSSNRNRPVEPSYVDLEDAKKGKNEDGSAHKGYLVLDVLGRKVVDLLDANGNSIVPEDEKNIVHIDGHGKGNDAESKARLLSEEMGGYLIMEGIYPYASWRCRCPSLHADVYSDMPTAASFLNRGIEKGHIKRNALIKSITPEFLKEYVANRK